jgi:hypothetical protein
MGENEILYSGKTFSLYSQIGLCDFEAKDSYPQWKTGDELVVFGLHGVAVATASDEQIEVIVCKGKVETQYSLCVSGEILLGKKGILVGNIAAATVANLLLPRGRYSVVIYTDRIGSETKQVHFCVNLLGS